MKSAITAGSKTPDIPKKLQNFTRPELSWSQQVQILAYSAMLNPVHREDGLFNSHLDCPHEPLG